MSVGFKLFCGKRDIHIQDYNTKRYSNYYPFLSSQLRARGLGRGRVTSSSLRASGSLGFVLCFVLHATDA